MARVMFPKLQKGLFLPLLFVGLCATTISATESKKTTPSKGVSTKQSAFETRYETEDGHNICAKFGGKYTQELFGSSYTDSLNVDVTNDRQIYARSTADFFIDFSYGVGDLARIQFHDTFRFRHKWGGNSDVSTSSTSVKVADVTMSGSSTNLGKHILWTREAWVKVMLGELEVRDDFVQVGLVPYSVGRGISLGSAYKAGGFLGFSPGFSIDQYAPGVVARCDLYPKKLFLEGYFALLENKHTSYKSNNETIRSSEILENGASNKRGINSFVYLCAFRSKATPLDLGKNKQLTVEPYFVFQHAPDQKIEFDNDSASSLKSFGIAAELTWKRFKCGGEFGVNRGSQEVRPWDRNEIKVVSDNGTLIQQYTKIHEGSLAGSLSTATTANIATVADSVKTIDKNGIEMYTGAGLYNAVDRFRPRQKKIFEGWFAVVDASYEIAPKNLTFVWGAGWASGELDKHTNVNDLGEGGLMNQINSGFVPLQSVYSGTKLRHLVMINAGIPRFAKQKPWETPTNNVVASSHGKDTISGFSNLSFIGGNLEWDVLRFKKYKLRIAPNVVHYWSPESPLLVDGTKASPSLGTELTLEVSAKVFNKIKVYSYGGVFLPGKQYTQMKEAGATANSIAIGNSPAYIVNIGATFAF